MTELRTDPALRRPPPAGVLQEVRRRGRRRRHAALAVVGAAGLVLATVAVVPPLLSTRADKAVPGATALAAAAPDRHRVVYALSTGTLTQDAWGHRGSLRLDRLTAVQAAGAFGWSASSTRSDALTVQLDSTDQLRHISAVDLFVPALPGQPAGAFTFHPDAPVSLHLRVGEVSTGTWTEDGHLFALTCERPQARLWRITLRTTPTLTHDVSPASFQLDLRQAPVVDRSPIMLALHARYGNGGTLDVDLRGTARAG